MDSSDGCGLAVKSIFKGGQISFCNGLIDWLNLIGVVIGVAPKEITFTLAGSLYGSFHGRCGMSNGSTHRG